MGKHGNVYLIYGKSTKDYIEVIHAIFANCIEPDRLYCLDVDFDTFKQNYSVICSSTQEQELKEKNVYRIPNEIIPNLFLGGYDDADKMLLILQKLKITHVLNCAKEFISKSDDGKSPLEYKVPEGTIVHHLGIADNSAQPINFSEYFQFIDVALYGDQQTQSSSSSSSPIIHHQSRVFVHCEKGISRSPSIIIGYLMEKFHLTFAEAYRITFHQREEIEPNPGFIKQLFLKEYELVDQFGE
ncbi:MAG: hypothetical protein EZS28_017349 [Streblomastix strix]|uniref:protein-tyrosine-phosphatase n=1 Tax=Streblomastix strix TaxID=222440 RepID=A0A5J4VX12_9EUKA|nr:MAG: hypothetical protein EZS28_017349 [Streblomastix strix]